jgi:hypothetical protein
MKIPFDAYELALCGISRWLTDAFGRPFQPADLYCPSKLAPVSVSLAKLRGRERENIENELNERLASEPIILLGTDAVKGVERAGGLLLIHFLPLFYDALIRHTIDILPEPVCINGETRMHYALDRMMMLSRKPIAPCPDDIYVQRALWLSFGIPERLTCKRLLDLRLRGASDALLTMTHHLPPAERPALANRSGGVARCAARLLTLGLKYSFGGDIQ